MFVLDTDVVSNLRRRKPHPELVKWLLEIDRADTFMSVGTVLDIQAGIERARRHDTLAANRVEAWFEGLLAAGHPQVLAFDGAAARLLARMWETPALRNFVVTAPAARHPAKPSDLMIAATAIVHGANVVTGNIRHFRQVHDKFPLPGLYDPFNAASAIDAAPQRET